MIIESTASELRETGISVIGDVRWGTHFCCFYETKEDLLETLVPYFKTGLENKEFCLWIVSQALSVDEARQALKQAVPDLERYLEAGDLEIHSHHDWYLRDGRWDPERVLHSWSEKLGQTVGNGYAGSRGAGDGGWIQNDDKMVFREYEKEVNQLLADQRSIILCTYPLTTSPSEQVFDIAHIHQAAVARRNGRWEMIELLDLKEAKAEIKRLNEELEQKVERRTRQLARTNGRLRAQIAERKLAEEAVKHSEDRIRLVIDTIPTMVWSLRPDGALDFVNQRWLDYTGISFRDALLEPNSTVHPEDLPRVVAKWRKDIAAAQPSEDELRLRRADGEYRWFLVRTVPLFDEQGNVLKWYGVSTDIEDRKRAEVAARALVDAIPHQIWSAPADGNLDYCNARWRAYMGIRLEESQGDGWQSMLHPEDRDRVLKAWRESVANGRPYEQEERHLGADGQYRWFLARGLPLRDPEGRIVRWYGTNTDIEGRKQAEKKVEEANNELRFLSRRLLEVQEQERRHLARELHDEIGQTLTAAKINLQIIGSQVGENATGPLADSIGLLNGLLQQVRQLSLDLHPSLLDDLGLVPALRSLLDQQGQRAGLRTHFKASDSVEKLDSRIEIAAFRIAQEAITNVLRHANARFLGLHLQVDARELQMKIIDDGKGFDIAAVEQGAREGTAFGLMGMKERAALVGGRVTVVSSAEKGTTIELCLPHEVSREIAPSVAPPRR
jgi:PAS domain S-box-containing protein